MTIQDVSPEQLAKVFHHYREALAHNGNHQGGGDDVGAWDRASHQERKLMLSAARLALLELSCASQQDTPDRPYFAKPGEAEWGC